MKANKKINLKFLLTLYDCLLRGMKLGALSATLDVPQDTLNWWRKNREDVKTVYEVAEARKQRVADFNEFMLGKLSKPARKMWNRVEWYLEADENEVPDVMNGDLANELRQEIFLHAMLSTNWNTSKSARLAGVTRDTVERWKEQVNFKMAMKELQEAKKDYFETALMRLVDEGYPGAIVFANRTQNADRGYNEKMQVEHTGTIHHAALNLDDLELDFETRRKILDAVRRKRELEPKRLTSGEVTDAEIVEEKKEEG